MYSVSDGTTCEQRGGHGVLEIWTPHSERASDKVQIPDESS